MATLKEKVIDNHTKALKGDKSILGVVEFKENNNPSIIEQIFYSACKVSPCNKPGLDAYKALTAEEKFAWWVSEQPLIKIGEDVELSSDDKLAKAYFAAITDAPEASLLVNSSASDLFLTNQITNDQHNDFIKLSPEDEIKFYKDRKFDTIWGIKLNQVAFVIISNLWSLGKISKENIANYFKVGQPIGRFGPVQTYGGIDPQTQYKWKRTEGTPCGGMLGFCTDLDVEAWFYAAKQWLSWDEKLLEWASIYAGKPIPEIPELNLLPQALMQLNGDLNSNAGFFDSSKVKYYQRIQRQAKLIAESIMIFIDRKVKEEGYLDKFKIPDDLLKYFSYDPAKDPTMGSGPIWTPPDFGFSSIGSGLFKLGLVAIGGYFIYKYATSKK